MGDHADDATNHALDMWMGEIEEELEDGMSYYLRRIRSYGPGSCPVCSSDTVLRNGRHGKFYGCSRFPECTGTRQYVKGLDGGVD